MGEKGENKKYSHTVELTATELSLLLKAIRQAKEKHKKLIKRQEQKKIKGKLEPGEYVPYDLLKIYESLENKLYQANIDVEEQVIDDVRSFHKERGKQPL